MSDALPHGFLLPDLLANDTRLYGRWDYLAKAWEAGQLSDAPLPRVPFSTTPDKATWHMLTRCLDAIPNHGTGGWQGWSSSAYFHYFLEWLLYGLHHYGQPNAPPEPSGCEGASDRLYKVLDLALWQANPYDYFGDLLAENAYGKRQGFFPTPHSVSELMTCMTISGDADARTQTVCDPCVGTGRMLLHASNHSLRLYGQDIDPLMCQATLINGFLFMPWLVRPLPFLDREHYVPGGSAALSDAMADQAPPHIAAVLAGSEHDTEQQWRFEPIKKRKKDGATPEPAIRQGVLFDP
jgi:hypothetical protein